MSAVNQHQLVDIVHFCAATATGVFSADSLLNLHEHPLLQAVAEDDQQPIGPSPALHPDETSQWAPETNDVVEACEVAGGSDDAAGSDQADGSEPLDSSIRKLAQLIVKDRETGCEYMIADFGDTQNSSQKLVNLSTNETRVLQYNTIEEQEIHGTESVASISTSASLTHAHSEAASDKKKMGAGKIWYGVAVAAPAAVLLIRAALHPVSTPP